MCFLARERQTTAVVYQIIVRYFFIIDENVILRSIFLRGTRSLCTVNVRHHCGVVNVYRISRDGVTGPWPRSNTFVKFM